MAKKIIALVSAIAMVVCFAVNASAADVATTTTYVDDETVAVNVVVTGIDEGANVTYYAKNDSTNVHIDQEKATAAGAEFDFYTDVANLESAVKIGYTNAPDSVDASIDAYKVTSPAGTAVYPTESKTIAFAWTPGTNKIYNGVEVTGATVADAKYAEGIVTITLSEVTADEVVVTVNEAIAPVGTVTATAEAIEAGAVKVAASVDLSYQGGIKIDGVKEGEDKDAANVTDENIIAGANADKVGDRKLTVIGKANGEGEYGIIVSEAPIESGKIWAEEFDANYASNAYAGGTKNATTGIFAIQLIDTSAEGAEGSFVKAGTSYYTAVYAYDEAAGAYVISAYSAAVTAN